MPKSEEDDRYCTVDESIEQSLKEMRLHRDGKIKLRTIDEAMAEWRKWAEEDEELVND